MLDALVLGPKFKSSAPMYKMGHEHTCTYNLSILVSREFAANLVKERKLHVQWEILSHRYKVECWRIKHPISSSPL